LRLYIELNSINLVGVSTGLSVVSKFEMGKNILYIALILAICGTFVAVASELHKVSLKLCCEVCEQ